MKVIGITGLAGSGKSSVLDYVDRKGYTTIEADRVAKMIMLEKKTITEVVKEFGMDIIEPTLGLINRGKLGKIVFSDPEKLKALEEIIIPKTRKAIKDFLDDYKEEDCVVFMESANMFNSGLNELCNSIIWVDADDTRRHKRLKWKGWSDEFIKLIDDVQKNFPKNKPGCIIFNNTKSFDKVLTHLDASIEMAIGVAK